MGTQKNCLNKTITLNIEIDMLKLKDSKIFTIFCLKLYNQDLWRFLGDFWNFYQWLCFVLVNETLVR